MPPQDAATKLMRVVEESYITAEREWDEADARQVPSVLKLESGNRRGPQSECAACCAAAFAHDGLQPLRHAESGRNRALPSLGPCCRRDARAAPNPVVCPACDLGHLSVVNTQRCVSLLARVRGTGARARIAGRSWQLVRNSFLLGCRCGLCLSSNRRRQASRVCG